MCLIRNNHRRYSALHSLIKYNVISNNASKKNPNMIYMLIVGTEIFKYIHFSQKQLNCFNKDLKKKPIIIQNLSVSDLCLKGCSGSNTVTNYGC